MGLLRRVCRSGPKGTGIRDPGQRRNSWYQIARSLTSSNQQQINPTGSCRLAAGDMGVPDSAQAITPGARSEVGALCPVNAVPRLAGDPGQVALHGQADRPSATPDSLCFVQLPVRPAAGRHLDLRWPKAVPSLLVRPAFFPVAGLCQWACAPGRGGAGDRGGDGSTRDRRRRSGCWRGERRVGSGPWLVRFTRFARWRGRSDPCRSDSGPWHPGRTSPQSVPLRPPPRSVNAQSTWRGPGPQANPLPLCQCGCHPRARDEPSARRVSRHRLTLMAGLFTTTWRETGWRALNAPLVRPPEWSLSLQGNHRPVGRR